MLQNDQERMRQTVKVHPIQGVGEEQAKVFLKTKRVEVRKTMVKESHLLCGNQEISNLREGGTRRVQQGEML